MRESVEGSIADEVEAFMKENENKEFILKGGEKFTLLKGGVKCLKGEHILIYRYLLNVK